jgi:hypothetical protein
MPAPIVAAAGLAARKLILRRLTRLALLALPVMAVMGAAVGLLVVLMLNTGGDDGSGTSAAGPCNIAAAGATTAAGLTPEQLANAQTIVAVGRQLNVPAYGWVIAVATALQESSLTNLTRGHLDSLGLFQQRSTWGPEADRLNPQTAARMFYTGGHGGQKGLLQVTGFQAMPLAQAAQSVQHSAFPDAYARWQDLAQQIVGNPAVLSATCYTDAAYRGDGTAGSNAVAAALQFVGTPYSWGGGGIGGPGKGFGPGATTTGFDCSSLVQYAYHAATGLTLPRVTDAQAADLPHVPPGTYHHVGIYDGQGGMVHAPRTGKTVEVVHNVLKDAYYSSQLALVARPGSDATGAAVAAKAGGRHG